MTILLSQEHDNKIKADAIAAYSLPVPYNMVQGSFDGLPTFSMDDFEGNNMCRSPFTTWRIQMNLL